jgi:hypothetical protein
MIKSKNAQITLLVLIAIVIVAGIILTAVLMKKPETKILPEENPQAFIQQCISEQLSKDEADLIYVNLYPNRTYNTITYRGISVPYLCSVSQFYIPCINQEPMLMGYVEKYLQNKTQINAEKCFVELVEKLKAKEYNVEETPLELKLELVNGAINIEINKKITTKKATEIKVYNKFSSTILSPLYRLIDTARNIINYESTMCEFDQVNWELYYRDIQIDKFSASDQTKVYTLTDKNGGKSINFAVKTCVIPAGI